LVSDNELSKEIGMFTKSAWLVIFATVFSAAAFGQNSASGTPDEAKAMLQKAVEALKADKTKALDMFNKGEGGFKDRDLYVFCADASTGVETAHPTHKGSKLQDIKDSTGFAFGEQMMTMATEGQIGEISYTWPKPGSKEPVQKLTYYTKVGDQICAVGSYK
jgi:signal transduction histidine kinase